MALWGICRVASWRVGTMASVSVCEYGQQLPLGGCVFFTTGCPIRLLALLLEPLAGALCPFHEARIAPLLVKIGIRHR
jgi:hypothetical protein